MQFNFPTAICECLIFPLYCCLDMSGSWRGVRMDWEIFHMWEYMANIPILCSCMYVHVSLAGVRLAVVSYSQTHSYLLSLLTSSWNLKPGKNAFWNSKYFPAPGAEQCFQKCSRLSAFETAVLLPWKKRTDHCLRKLSRSCLWFLLCWRMCCNSGYVSGNPCTVYNMRRRRKVIQWIGMASLRARPGQYFKISTILKNVMIGTAQGYFLSWSVVPESAKSAVSVLRVRLRGVTHWQHLDDIRGFIFSA